MSEDSFGVVLQLLLAAVWAVIVAMRALSKRQQPTETLEHVEPAPVEPVPTPADLQARIARLAERAAALSSTVRGEAAFARFVRIYESEVVREIDRLRLALRERAAAERSVEIARELSGIEKKLGVYERLAAQRKGGRLGEALADADALLSDMLQPLAAHGRAEGRVLRANIPATVFGGVPAIGDSKLVLVEIAPEFGAHLLDWDGLLLHAGERLFHDVPGLAAECYERLGLDPRALAGSFGDGYDFDRAYACFGPWLPALFSEVATTLQLGEAHALAIAARYPRGFPVTVARSEGFFVQRDPPPHLRMLASLATLEELGQHRQALAVAQRWRAQHGESTSSYLPLQDGRLLEVETASLAELLEVVLEALLREPRAALGGTRLQAVAGFAQGPHEHQVQRELVPRLRRREAVAAPPRTALGAALTAWLELDAVAGSAAHDSLLRAFRGSLAGKTSRVAERSAATAKPTGSGGGKGGSSRSFGSALRGDLRSGAAWAEAVVLQAAIGRRR